MKPNENEEYWDCHECEYWLPDEEECRYKDIPPCFDNLYKK